MSWILSFKWSLIDRSLVVISSTSLGIYLDPGTPASPCGTQRLERYFIVILDIFPGYHLLWRVALEEPGADVFGFCKSAGQIHLYT